MSAQNTNTQTQTVWNEQTLQSQCLSHSLPLNIFQHYKESSDQPGEGQGPHGNGKLDVERLMTDKTFQLTAQQNRKHTSSSKR